MTFEFTRHSQIPDIIIIEGKKFEDTRGFFMESYRHDEFIKYGIPHFVQENHSHSKASTLRGLHYQLNPKAQGKLVSCLSGVILDIAVDIRQGSPTYKHYVSVVLDGHSSRMVYIPPGFAHGLLVDKQFPYTAEVVYKTTEYFAPEFERCIRWSDPDINISWGLWVDEKSQLNMSEKDANAPLLRDAENNFIWIK